MPSSVLPISGVRQGTYVLLEAVLPERPPCPIGVLLIDLGTGRPWFRMRRDLTAIADPEDAEVLEQMEGIARCGRTGSCGGEQPGAAGRTCQAFQRGIRVRQTGF